VTSSTSISSQSRAIRASRSRRMRAPICIRLSRLRELASGPYSLPARVGRRRREVRALLVSSALLAPSASRRAAARCGACLRDALGRRRRLEKLDDADPFEYARGWLKRHRVLRRRPALRFGGGLVGYFGYETVRHIEPRALGSEKPDPLGTPGMLLLVSDELAVVDNVLGKLYLVVYADPQQPGAFRGAQERLERLRARLVRPLPESMVLSQFGNIDSLSRLEQTFSESGFMDAVRALEGIHLRWRLPCRYRSRSAPRGRSRRRRSRFTGRCEDSIQSPYMFYFDFDDHHVVGASPEILVQALRRRHHPAPHCRHAAARPYPEEDAAVAEELLADPKERAEHVMLIDLGRNDVGRWPRREASR